MVNHHDINIYHRQLLDAISTINEFTKDISSIEFVQDKKTLHACLMILVHIGEILATMQKRKITIPYPHHQKIIDMRNFLAHQYIDIRPSLVAKTIYEDIPLFAEEIKKQLS